MNSRDDADDEKPSVFLDDGADDDLDTVELSNNAVQLNTLIDVANAFRNTRDMRSIFEKIVSLIFTTIPADRVAILLKDSDEAEFVNGFGRNRNRAAQDILASRTISSRVYKVKAPIMSNDLYASGLQAIQSLKDAKVRSLICVPLATFDRRYGVIYADSGDLLTKFDQDHLDWLMTVATMAALALATSSYIEDVYRDLTGPHNLIGKSTAMLGLQKHIATVAPAKSTVLILGETGTGKELVARAVHLTSKRSAAVFVAVNCATLTGDLLENELFGHEQGSFTGANRRYIGKFERASGGTLFLDEVGELPMTTQGKLLRVLQEREIERVGGSGPIEVDIRLIAATNRDLPALVKAGQFREDLFYRLNVLCIQTPPLRERREDIPLLARHFLLKFSKENGRPAPNLSADAEVLLVNYPWPGNVRQLENVMENAVVCSESNIIREENLRSGLSGIPGMENTTPQTYKEFRKASTVAFLTNALNRHGWDRKQAAASIRVTRTSLDKWVRRLGISQISEQSG